MESSIPGVDSHTLKAQLNSIAQEITYLNTSGRVGAINMKEAGKCINSFTQFFDTVAAQHGTHPQHILGQHVCCNILMLILEKIVKPVLTQYCYTSAKRSATAAATTAAATTSAAGLASSSPAVHSIAAQRILAQGTPLTSEDILSEAKARQVRYDVIRPFRQLLQSLHTHLSSEPRTGGGGTVGGASSDGLGETTSGGGGSSSSNTFLCPSGAPADNVRDATGSSGSVFVPGGGEGLHPSSTFPITSSSSGGGGAFIREGGLSLSHASPAITTTEGLSLAPLLWKNAAPLICFCNHALEVLQSDALAPVVGVEYAHMLRHIVQFDGYARQFTQDYVADVCDTLLTLMERVEVSVRTNVNSGDGGAVKTRNTAATSTTTTTTTTATTTSGSSGLTVVLFLPDEGTAFAELLADLFLVPLAATTFSDGCSATAAASAAALSVSLTSGARALRRGSYGYNKTSIADVTSRLAEYTTYRHQHPTAALRLEAKCLCALRRLTSAVQHDYSQSARVSLDLVRLLSDYVVLPEVSRKDVWRLEALEYITSQLCLALSGVLGRCVLADLQRMNDFSSTSAAASRNPVRSRVLAAAATVESKKTARKLKKDTTYQGDTQIIEDTSREDDDDGGVRDTYIVEDAESSAAVAAVAPRTIFILHETVLPMAMTLFKIQRQDYSFISRRELFHFPCSALDDVFDFGALVVYLASATATRYAGLLRERSQLATASTTVASLSAGMKRHIREADENYDSNVNEDADVDRCHDDDDTERRRRGHHTNTSVAATGKQGVEAPIDLVMAALRAELFIGVPTFDIPPHSSNHRSDTEDKKDCDEGGKRDGAPWHAWETLDNLGRSCGGSSFGSRAMVDTITSAATSTRLSVTAIQDMVKDSALFLLHLLAQPCTTLHVAPARCDILVESYLLPLFPSFASRLGSLLLAAVEAIVPRCSAHVQRRVYVWAVRRYLPTATASSEEDRVPSEAVYRLLALLTEGALSRGEGPPVVHLTAENVLAMRVNGQQGDSTAHADYEGHEVLGIRKDSRGDDKNVNGAGDDEEEEKMMVGGAKVPRMHCSDGGAERITNVSGNKMTAMKRQRTDTATTTATAAATSLFTGVPTGALEDAQKRIAAGVHYHAISEQVRARTTQAFYQQQQHRTGHADVGRATTAATGADAGVVPGRRLSLNTQLSRLASPQLVAAMTRFLSRSESAVLYALTAAAPPATPASGATQVAALLPTVMMSVLLSTSSSAGATSSGNALGPDSFARSRRGIGDGGGAAVDGAEGLAFLCDCFAHASCFFIMPHSKATATGGGTGSRSQSPLSPLSSFSSDALGFYRESLRYSEMYAAALALTHAASQDHFAVVSDSVSAATALMPTSLLTSTTLSSPFVVNSSLRVGSAVRARANALHSTALYEIASVLRSPYACVPRVATMAAEPHWLLLLRSSGGGGSGGGVSFSEDTEGGNNEEVEEEDGGGHRVDESPQADSKTRSEARGGTTTSNNASLSPLLLDAIPEGFTASLSQGVVASLLCLVQRSQLALHEATTFADTSAAAAADAAMPTPVEAGSIAGRGRGGSGATIGGDAYRVNTAEDTSATTTAAALVDEDTLTSMHVTLCTQCVQFAHLLMRWHRRGLWQTPEELRDAANATSGAFGRYGGDQRRFQRGKNNRGSVRAAAAVPSDDDNDEVIEEEEEDSGARDLHVLSTTPEFLSDPRSVLPRLSEAGRIYYALLWCCELLATRLRRAALIPYSSTLRALLEMFTDVGASLLSPRLACGEPRQCVMRMTGVLARRLLTDGITGLSRWRPVNATSEDVAVVVTETLSVCADLLRVILTTSQRTCVMQVSVDPLVDPVKVCEAVIEVFMTDTELLSSSTTTTTTTTNSTKAQALSSSEAARQWWSAVNTATATSSSSSCVRNPLEGPLALLLTSSTGASGQSSTASTMMPPFLPATLPSMESLVHLVQAVAFNFGERAAHTASVHVVAVLFARYRYNMIGSVLRMLARAGDFHVSDTRRQRFSAAAAAAAASQGDPSALAIEGELLACMIDILVGGGAAAAAGGGYRPAAMATSLLPSMSSFFSSSSSVLPRAPLFVPALQCTLLSTIFRLLPRCCDAQLAEKLGKFSFSFMTETTPFVVRRHAATHVSLVFRLFSTHGHEVLRELLLRARDGILSVQPLLCSTSLLALSEAARAAPWLEPHVVYTLLECWAMPHFRFKALVLECLTRIAGDASRRSYSSLGSSCFSNSNNTSNYSGGIGVGSNPEKSKLSGGGGGGGEAGGGGGRVAGYAQLCRAHASFLLHVWLWVYQHSYRALPAACFGYATPEELLFNHISTVLPTSLLLSTGYASGPQVHEESEDSMLRRRRAGGGRVKAARKSGGGSGEAGAGLEHEALFEPSPLLLKLVDLHAHFQKERGDYYYGQHQQQYFSNDAAAPSSSSSFAPISGESRNGVHGEDKRTAKAKRRRTDETGAPVECEASVSPAQQQQQQRTSSAMDRARRKTELLEVDGGDEEEAMTTLLLRFFPQVVAQLYLFSASFSSVESTDHPVDLLLEEEEEGRAAAAAAARRRNAASNSGHGGGSGGASFGASQAQLKRLGEAADAALYWLEQTINHTTHSTLTVGAAEAATYNDISGGDSPKEEEEEEDGEDGRICGFIVRLITAMRGPIEGAAAQLRLRRRMLVRQQQHQQREAEDEMASGKPRERSNTADTAGGLMTSKGSTRRSGRGCVSAISTGSSVIAGGSLFSLHRSYYSVALEVSAEAVLCALMDLQGVDVPLASCHMLRYTANSICKRIKVSFMTQFKGEYGALDGFLYSNSGDSVYTLVQHLCADVMTTLARGSFVSFSSLLASGTGTDTGGGGGGGEGIVQSRRDAQRLRHKLVLLQSLCTRWVGAEVLQLPHVLHTIVTTCTNLLLLLSSASSSLAFSFQSSSSGASSSCSGMCVRVACDILLHVWPVATTFLERESSSVSSALAPVKAGTSRYARRAALVGTLDTTLAVTMLALAPRSSLIASTWAALCRCDRFLAAKDWQRLGANFLMETTASQRRRSLCSSSSSSSASELDLVDEARDRNLATDAAIVTEGEQRDTLSRRATLIVDVDDDEEDEGEREKDVVVARARPQQHSSSAIPIAEARAARRTRKATSVMPPLRRGSPITNTTNPIDYNRDRRSIFTRLCRRRLRLMLPLLRSTSFIVGGGGPSALFLQELTRALDAERDAVAVCIRLAVVALCGMSGGGGGGGDVTLQGRQGGASTLEDQSSLAAQQAPLLVLITERVQRGGNDSNVEAHVNERKESHCGAATRETMMMCSYSDLNQLYHRCSTAEKDFIFHVYDACRNALLFLFDVCSSTHPEGNVPSSLFSGMTAAASASTFSSSSSTRMNYGMLSNSSSNSSMIGRSKEDQLAALELLRSLSWAFIEAGEALDISRAIFSSRDVLGDALLAGSDHNSRKRRRLLSKEAVAAASAATPTPNALSSAKTSHKGGGGGSERTAKARSLRQVTPNNNTAEPVRSTTIVADTDPVAEMIAHVMGSAYAHHMRHLYALSFHSNPNVAAMASFTLRRWLAEDLAMLGNSSVGSDTSGSTAGTRWRIHRRSARSTVKAALDYIRTSAASSSSTSCSPLHLRKAGDARVLPFDTAILGMAWGMWELEEAAEELEDAEEKREKEEEEDAEAGAYDSISCDHIANSHARGANLRTLSREALHPFYRAMCRGGSIASAASSGPMMKTTSTAGTMDITSMFCSSTTSSSSTAAAATDATLLSSLHLLDARLWRTLYRYHNERSFLPLFLIAAINTYGLATKSRVLEAALPMLAFEAAAATSGQEELFAISPSLAAALHISASSRCAMPPPQDICFADSFFSVVLCHVMLSSTGKAESERQRERRREWCELLDLHLISHARAYPRTTRLLLHSLHMCTCIIVQAVKTTGVKGCKMRSNSTNTTTASAATSNGSAARSTRTVDNCDEGVADKDQGRGGKDDDDDDDDDLNEFSYDAHRTFIMSLLTAMVSTVGQVPQPADMAECMWLSDIPAQHLAAAAVAVHEPHLAVFFSEWAGESLLGTRKGIPLGPRSSDLYAVGDNGAPPADASGQTHASAHHAVSLLFPHATLADTRLSVSGPHGSGSSTSHHHHTAGRQTREDERNERVLSRLRAFYAGVLPVFEAVASVIQMDGTSGDESSTLWPFRLRTLDANVLMCQRPSALSQDLNAGTIMKSTATATEEMTAGLRAVAKARVLLNAGLDQVALEVLLGATLLSESKPTVPSAVQQSHAGSTSMEGSAEEVMKVHVSRTLAEEAALRDTLAEAAWRCSLWYTPDDVSSSLLSSSLVSPLVLERLGCGGHTSANVRGFSSSSGGSRAAVMCSASPSFSSLDNIPLPMSFNESILHALVACRRRDTAALTHALKAGQTSVLRALHPSSFLQGMVALEALRDVAECGRNSSAFNGGSGGQREAMTRCNGTMRRVSDVSCNLNNSGACNDGVRPPRWLEMDAMEIRSGKSARIIRSPLLDDNGAAAAAAGGAQSKRQCREAVSRIAVMSSSSYGGTAMSSSIGGDDYFHYHQRQLPYSYCRTLDAVRGSLCQLSENSEAAWVTFLRSAAARALREGMPQLAYRWTCEFESCVMRACLQSAQACHRIVRTLRCNNDDDGDEDGDDGCGDGRASRRREGYPLEKFTRHGLHISVGTEDMVDVVLLHAQSLYGLGMRQEAMARLQAPPLQLSSSFDKRNSADFTLNSADELLIEAQNLFRLPATAFLNPHVVHRLVLWSRETQTVPLAQLVRDPFLTKALSNDPSGACTFQLAYLCHTLARDIAARLRTHEYKQLRASIAESRQTLRALEAQLAASSAAVKASASATRAGASSSPPPPPLSGAAAVILTKEEEALVKTRVRTLWREMAAEEEELNREVSSYALYRRSALNAYGKYLQLSGPHSGGRGGEDDDVHAAFLFVGLWLREHDGDDAAALADTAANSTMSSSSSSMQRSGAHKHNEIVEKVLTKTITQTPLYKFLPLFQQLAAQLGGDSNSTTTTTTTTTTTGSGNGNSSNDNTRDQNTISKLEELVLRIACEHPLQTVWPLLALSNGGKFGSTREVNTAHSVDTAKVAAAQRILTRMKSRHPLADLTSVSSPSSAAVLLVKLPDHVEAAWRQRRQYVEDAEKLSVAYIELAFTPPSTSGAKSKMHIIPSHLLIAKLNTNQALSIPPPTISVPSSSLLMLAHEIEISTAAAAATTTTSSVLPSSSPSFPTVMRFALEYTTPGGINLPKALTCILSDGQAVRQLLKSNDDLRQDALIEQVFSMANTLFLKGVGDPSSGDASQTGTSNTTATATAAVASTSSSAAARMGGRGGCTTRELRVYTYSVVPLAPTVGILQWVDNTMPLGEYLTGTPDGSVLGAHERYFPGEYTTWECRAKLSEAPKTLKTGTLLSIYANFTPALHYFFFEHYASLQEWLERRQAYARSVAASSMVGFIVGLGDRHGSNLLLHRRTAELVHIDLGIAFDQNKLLAIPELVPFRLTRNIVDGFGVRGVDGGFAVQCVAALNVLRARRDVLLTILEAFVHDPLARWVLCARREEGSGGDAAVALRKNKNQNAEEKPEEARHRRTTPADAQRTIARVTAKLNGYDGGEQLSVQTQVQKLLQSAQSVENLSAMYPGWSPWV